jgi:hypothetical protein
MEFKGNPRNIKEQEMSWGLLRQFQFLTMVDQPVFVHIFPVLGPPITVRGISARSGGIPPVLPLELTYFVRCSSLS